MPEKFVMQSAADYYEELSGFQLNVAAIKINAVIQELAAYANKLTTNKLDHPGFLRSAKHLQKWLPEDEWEKVLDNTK